MGDLRLSRRDLDPDPRAQLVRWRADAGPPDDSLLDAVALATATAGGRPSVRMVLVKGLAGRGIEFFTGYESRKGADLVENPRAAILFHWPVLGRQARVEGAVERLPAADSDAYFVSRPLGARLSAAGTRQGDVVDSRKVLEDRVAVVRDRFGDEGPPRPGHWGGYRLVPDSYEFWQHRDDRLHDRFRYRRVSRTWVVERLAP